MDKLYKCHWCKCETPEEDMAYTKQDDGTHNNYNQCWDCWDEINDNDD